MGCQRVKRGAEGDLWHRRRRRRRQGQCQRSLSKIRQVLILQVRKVVEASWKSVYM